MAKSMNYNQAAGLTGMLKEGHKTYEGVHGAVLRNIEAAKAIAGMVQTSLGPNGMNKLVVNHLEKITVTSDCAAIMGELEVQHPAAKLLVLASEMQQNEFGDNTNFVRLHLLGWLRSKLTSFFSCRSFHLLVNCLNKLKSCSDRDCTRLKSWLVTRERMKRLLKYFLSLFANL